ncbi:Dipeptide-binding protein [Budvicia aquatica]|nr:Dipeptide-binding protein [Budvicia aquatica]
MHDQAPALMIAHSTVSEPVRKEVKGYLIDGRRHSFATAEINK